jgi:hypothetical protein
VSTDVIKAADEDAPTTELVTGVVGDRCVNCQAPLAADQRYCVNCGERRGTPRFSYESMAGQAAPAAADAGIPPRQRWRFSSGTSLVAGVATLLIAMGVGVLIGHDSNSVPARTPPPQVITLNGGGATGAATGTGTTSNATTAGTHKASKGGKTKVVHVTAKSAAAASNAAAKVLGSGGNLSKNVSQQVGGSCTGGSGCQNGKFTGNFFSGG